MTTMSKSPTRKGGRPSKPTDEKRTHVVTIKLTDAEHAHLKKRSKAAGVKLAEYVRHGRSGSQSSAALQRLKRK